MLTDYEDRIYCAPSPAEVKGKQDKQQQQEQAVQKGTGALFAAARLLRCLHARTAALLHCTLPTLPASAPKPYPNPRSYDRFRARLPYCLAPDRLLALPTRGPLRTPYAHTITKYS
jgi:hypothetical protein